MQKQIYTLVFVVIIGILAGVAVVKQQVREPLLHEILEGQAVLLQAQTEIGTKLGDSGTDLQLEVRLQALEARLGNVEAQLKGLLVGGVAVPGGGNARQAPPAPPQEDLSKVYTIPVAHSPVKGNKKAPVTIVEFVDFQCPFCARFHPPIVETLKAYPKDVNYVLKNFPLGFHQQARPAAKAAFAAGEQGKYWEMVDVLLENGKSLSEEKFEEFAGTLGLNVKKFKKDYADKDGKFEKLIQADMDLAQEVNVRGTPTFYLNGKKTNARDFNSFKKEIDGILGKKK